jgi:hypothetical protein
MILPASSMLPDAITGDPAVLGRFKVDLAEILSATMTESEWKKFGTRFDLGNEITRHPRFLRSLQWGDPDYDGHVLDLVEHLCSSNPAAVQHLVGMPAVQKGLSDDLLAAWNGEADPLVVALSHSLEEVVAAQNVVDLGGYNARVEDALPGDPQRAVGATKDLLEATMRTILNARNVTGIEKLSFPELTNTCFKQLGLAPGGVPASEAEKKVRKIVDNAKKMILAANELRDLAGTGHGRVVGSEETLSADDASLVASSGMILAAWLLRRGEDG